MSKSKFDPLEQAKVVADKAKKLPVAPKAKKMSVPEPAPAPAPKTPAPAVAATLSKTYKVKATKMVSWRGHLTTIREGTIIRDHNYDGPEGIARLRDSGVELEELS